MFSMKLIRLPTVELKTGLRHSAIYERMAAGTFPRSVPIGTKAVAWVESEIDEWIQDRIAERDEAYKEEHATQ
jgi:prophage regulatory protein